MLGMLPFVADRCWTSRHSATENCWSAALLPSDHPHSQWLKAKAEKYLTLSQQAAEVAAGTRDGHSFGDYDADDAGAPGAEDQEHDEL